VRPLLRATDGTMACESGILDGRWVATLCVYWEAAPSDRRVRIRRHLERARTEPIAERCIHELQQAMRVLGLTDLQIIRLVLIRCLDLAEEGHPSPVAQVADEIDGTIRSLDARRRNGCLRS